MDENRSSFDERVVEDMAHRLRRQLLTQLRTHQRLPAPQDLATRLAVREALVTAAYRSLERDGLVYRETSGRVRVRPREEPAINIAAVWALHDSARESVSIKALREVLASWSTLAGRTAVRATTRGDEVDLRLLFDLSRTGDSARSPARALIDDAAFYAGMAESASDPVLTLVTNTFRVCLMRCAPAFAPIETALGELRRRRRAVIAALLERDGVAAHGAAMHHAEWYGEVFN